MRGRENAERGGPRREKREMPSERPKEWPWGESRDFFAEGGEGSMKRIKNENDRDR